MKKTTKLAVAAFCAVAVSGLVASRFASAASFDRIYIYDGEKSVTCDIYNADSSAFSNICDTGYGSYDIASRTLTLGNKMSELSSSATVNMRIAGGLTVKSNTDLSLRLGLSSMDLILDLEEKKLTTNWISNTDGKIVFKSGTIISGSVSAKAIEIIGGDITINTDSVPLDVSDTINIRGGKLKAEGNGFITAKKVLISGGEIDAAGKISNAGSVNLRSAIDVDGGGSVEINGGNIALSNVYSGIDIDGGGKFNINAGNLTINNVRYGIISRKGVIQFNGGTTIITNSTTYAVEIMDAVDPEHDIMFGTGMGIKENIPVFWSTADHIDNTTGIVASNVVTIANGYTYKKVYGWDIGEIGGDVDIVRDDDDKKESKDNEDKKEQKGLILEGSGEEKKSDKKDNKDKTVPGAPNTGLFGENKAFAVAAAVTVAPVLGIAGYLAVAAKKRADRKVSFKKR